VVTKGLIVAAPIINLETQEAWGAVVHLKKELAVRDFMGATYGEPRNVGVTKLAEALQSTYVAGWLARRVTLSFPALPLPAALAATVLAKRGTIPSPSWTRWMCFSLEVAGVSRQMVSELSPQP
jgi:hypothetical protein